MPTGVIIIWTSVGVVMFLGGLGILTWLFLGRGIGEYESNQEHIGWTDTAELELWNEQDREARRRERETCPVDQGGCGGTRCYDWRYLGAVCGENPTEADGSLALERIVGKHFEFSVKPVPAGYWPLPKTYFARTRRDLWDKVADHCQISLHRPAGTVLA